METSGWNGMGMPRERSVWRLVKMESAHGRKCSGEREEIGIAYVESGRVGYAGRQFVFTVLQVRGTGLRCAGVDARELWS
jgi:hypothetical protein